MSTLFTQNLWMFGKLALVLSAAFLVFEAIIWVRKNPISWRVPGGSRLTGGIQSMWNTHGVATLKSLALISACLFFINMLCAQTGYEWWRSWRNESGLFWTAQFALVFSCYILMTRVSLIAKLTALIVIGIVISGIVKTVNRPRAAEQQQVESSVKAAPSVVHVPVGGWFDVYPDRDSKMNVQPIEPGVICDYMINDDPKRWRSPDENGKELDLSEQRLGVKIWRVRVLPVNKAATFVTTTR